MGKSSLWLIQCKIQHADAWIEVFNQKSSLDPPMSASVRNSQFWIFIEYCIGRTHKSIDEKEIITIGKY